MLGPGTWEFHMPHACFSQSPASHLQHKCGFQPKGICTRAGQLGAAPVLSPFFPVPHSLAAVPAWLQAAQPWVSSLPAGSCSCAVASSCLVPAQILSVQPQHRHQHRKNLLPPQARSSGSLGQIQPSGKVQKYNYLVLYPPFKKYSGEPTS